jgi:alpha-amylase
MMAHHLMQNAIKTETGTKLLLSPGVKCIGDESARSLVIEGTQGDATYDLYELGGHKINPETQKTLLHWQKLGQFRKIIHQLEQEFTSKFRRNRILF